MSALPSWCARVEPDPQQAAALRDARLARGWSNKQLAAHLGCSSRYLRYLQAGERTPSQRMVIRIERSTGVRIPLPAVEPELSAASRRATAILAAGLPLNLNGDQLAMMSPLRFRRYLEERLRRQHQTENPARVIETLPPLTFTMGMRFRRRF